MTIPRAYNLLAAATALAALGGAARADTTADAATAGRRYGQAEAVAAHCPGGKATAKARELKAKFSGADLTVFETESSRIVGEWKAALSCVEADPETGRMNVRCRQVKRLSCSQAWREIGPEGSEVPGLIELEFRD